MRRTTLGTPKTPRVSRNTAEALDEEEVSGTARPAESAVEARTSIGIDEFYDPPDAAAEIPEAIPRDDVVIRD